jgi:N-methylhydantoinase B
MSASSAVVSGTDWRRGGAPFVNFLALPPCGPATYGHDGWLTFAVACAGGAVSVDSIEIDEQKYPIIFDKNEIAMDSAGPGQWDGAPAADIIYGFRKDPGTLAWVIDEKYNPAKGVRGGMSGRPCNAYRLNLKTGEKLELPTMAAMDFSPDERMISEAQGGAGYGDPLDRDPELVRLRVREGWTSLKKARDIYGVVLDTSVEQFAVDYEETEKLREKLRKRGDC